MSCSLKKNYITMECEVKNQMSHYLLIYIDKNDKSINLI